MPIVTSASSRKPIRRSREGRRLGRSRRLRRQIAASALGALVPVAFAAVGVLSAGLGVVVGVNEGRAAAGLEAPPAPMTAAFLVNAVRSPSPQTISRGSS